MGDGNALVRGRGRLSARALSTYLGAVRELRGMGASVVKIGADGSIVIAFEGAYLGREDVEPAKPAPAAEKDADALFDSADE